MKKTWWMKSVFLIVITLLSVATVLPTFIGSSGKGWFSKKINLGLDLQGGLYLVMGVNFDQVFREMMDRQKSSLEERLKEKSVSIQSIKVLRDGFPKDDPRIEVQFQSAQKAAVLELLTKEFVNLRQTEDQSEKLVLGLSTEVRSDVRERTLNQSVEVIRNRIDEFGVSEPSISTQGTDRVIVELPGIKDVDHAKELIGRTAKLEFRMVDEEGLQKINLDEVIAASRVKFTDGTEQKFSEYVQKLNEDLQAKLPADSEIAFEKQGDVKIPLLLKRKSEVTGNDLQDAQVSMNQENQRPEVAFELNPRGAIAFEKLTGENIGKRLAIVLDGIVHSAPSINSKIGARGVITTGRGGYDEALRESKDLAIVLRAGALPAQLDLMEQRVVGPSLGADSVQKGAFASILGVLAVFLLTAVYYRVSGLIAVVSLFLNVTFVLAILVFLEATLTLPGIAGIALTVGIAVDSNVVIYERIREELHLGKALRVAVEAGFDKAFKTIMDANVANALAAVILMVYGSGPVRGFAVTMMVGIITTLFSAVFVCRLFFDAYLKRLEERSAKTLSI